MTSLTKRRLAAISEALNARLAGEIDVMECDDFKLTFADYEAALQWTREQLTKKGDQK
jgi:hypothetical protein